MVQRSRASEREASIETWGRAALKSILVLGVAIAVFALVPDRLLEFLSTRVGPRARDALVLAWFAPSLVIASWTLTVTQGRRGS